MDVFQITKIRKRGIVASLLPIVFITLMGIGLALEGDIEISLCGVAILQQSHQPFQDIPYKEPYEQ